MHCELLVPGLFSASAQARLPALEMLLARGRSESAPSQRLEAWLQQAFELEEQPLAAGALTLLGSGHDPGSARWARADPVHLRLMRDRLILVPAAALEISRQEAEALCTALSAHFAGALAFQAVDPRRWCARLEKELELGEAAPLEMAGREVLLARAGDALLNEVQMLLHAHPVNEAREARGEPPLNSLWLWGAGCVPREARCRWSSICSGDPLALGLARLAGVRHPGLPASAGAWLDRAPEEGRHLVILDALRAPLALSQEAEYRAGVEALERGWFAPLLGALREGRVGMVTLQVPDAAAAASFETIRGDLRRFWRRPKALERYA